MVAAAWWDVYADLVHSSNFFLPPALLFLPLAILIITSLFYFESANAHSCNFLHLCPKHLPHLICSAIYLTPQASHIHLFYVDFFSFLPKGFCKCRQFQSHLREVKLSMRVKFLLVLWKHIVLKKSTTVGVLMYMLDTTAAKKGTTLLKGSKERRMYDAHVCEIKLFIFVLFAICITLTEGRF